MEKVIKHKIIEIEEKHQVKVIWAIESGSRAWGFASNDSDWDVRFLYVNRPEWYLTVFPKRDVIEEMDGELDLAGWDLRKTLGLLCKSNPPLNEWMKSAIIYWQMPEAADELRTLASLYFNPKSVAYHYYRMALNDWNDYVKNQASVRAKKYLYILRELLACNYVEHSLSAPPIRIEELAVQLDEAMYEKYTELVDVKGQGTELGKIASDPIINAWIEENLSHFEDFASKLELEAKHPTEDLDKYLAKWAYRAWE